MPNKNGVLSRVENILESMLGKAELEVTAQSRIEKLLVELKEAIEEGGTGGDTTALAARIAQCEKDITELKNIDAEITTALRELSNDLNDVNNDIESLQNDKVDKVNGKGLSTEDYTTIEKNKLSSLENYDDTEVRGLITAESEAREAADEETTAALAELVDSGAKNLLKNTAPYGNSVRTNITFSHNSDDSYIINAENANTQNTDFYVATDVQIKPGTYKLSGCPAGGDNSSTYKLQIAGIGYDMGDGLTFTIVQATTINVYIRIWAGYVPNGLVFKPMICTKTACDISQEYVPYRPSYQELYDRILALENQQ